MNSQTQPRTYYAEAIHGGKPLRGVFLPRITIEGD
jgi:hypothetical protein